MSSRELVLGYAFLKASAASQKINNPIDALDALVLRAIIKLPSKSFVASSLQKAIRQVWSLEIPIAVCQYALSRQTKLGNLRLIDNKGGAFAYSSSVSDETRNAIANRERDAGETIKRVINKIERFIKGENPHDKTKGSDVLEKWLDTSALALMNENFRPEAVTSEDRKINILISRIMGILNSIDDPFVEDITTLAIGDAMFRSVKSLTEIEAPTDEADLLTRKSMSNVEVYLDTGIIFRILGYYGTILQKAGEELLEILLATGCKVRIFDHTLDELTLGLTAVASRLRSADAPYGAIVNYAVENALDPSDLITEAARLRTNIEALKVQIVQRPERQESINLDERSLDALLEKIVKQENPIARRRDVDSLAAIYNMRRGKGRRFLESCDAIFVTNNRTMADASSRYFSRTFYENGEQNSVQICMTDVVFCTRLWIKLPTQAAATPRLQILGHAVGNLKPNERVVKKFKTVIDQWVSKGEVAEEEALRIEYSEFVRLSLAMDYQDEDSLGPAEVKNLVLRAIEESKERFDRIVGDRVDTEVAALKDRVQQLSVQVENMSSEDDFEGDKARAVDQIGALTEAIQNKSTCIKRRVRLADVVAGLFVLLPVTVVVFGTLIIALRDVEIHDVLGLSLNSKGSAYLRFGSAMTAAIMTTFGFSCLSIYIYQRAISSKGCFSERYKPNCYCYLLLAASTRQFIAL